MILQKRKNRCFGGVITVMKEHLQQNMDVEFMNVHVRRNKLKLSMNHLRRSLAHVIVVDVQVIIHLIVMQEPIQTVMIWSKNGSSSF